MKLRTDVLPAEQVYAILANERRRRALEQLGSVGGVVTVHELSELVAGRETGESPPPKRCRESVYTSLVQTHLPKLEEVGVVEYDRETQTIELSRHARDVALYTEIVAKGGVTWSELYRALGVASLTVLLAALLDVPLVSAVDPVLWTSLALGAFALTGAYQLWVNRFSVLRQLRIGRNGLLSRRRS
jgi:DNA-binding transcriptional ArsR family regulator